MWLGRNDVNWYQDCENMFIELFGEEKLWLVTRLFAATSINSSLPSNVTLFRKAYYEVENNLPVGNYLPNIRSQLLRLRYGLDLSGRKIRSFAAAMSGDHDAVVVDVWLTRAFKVDRKYLRKPKEGKSRGLVRDGGVTDGAYTQIEEYIREESAKCGLKPREMSAMIWAGIRIDVAGNKESHYKQRLQYHFNNLFGVI